MKMKTQQKLDTTAIKSRRTPRGALLPPASTTIASSSTTTASTTSNSINKSATTTSSDHDNHAIPPTMDLPNDNTTTLLAPTSMDAAASQDSILEAEKHEARRIARRAKTSLTSEEGRARDSVSNQEENSMVDMNSLFTPGAYSVPGDKALEEEAEPNDEIENIKGERGDYPATRMHAGQGQSTLSLIVAAELVDQVDDPNDEEWKRKIQQEVESRLMERDQTLTVAEIVLTSTNPTKAETTDQEQCLQCCWRWKFLLSLMLLCICGGVTGIIIWATGTLEPDSPTFAPTPSPTLDERQQKIMDILQKHAANLTTDKGDHAVDDPNSPQSLALDWLLFNDTNSVLAKLSNTSDLPPSTILERYGLAVFFFSTNGPLWKNRLEFLTEKSVCEWNDGESETTTAGVSSTTNVPANLSHTYGVYCDVGQTTSSSSSTTQDLVVQQIRLSQNDLVGTIPSELGLLSHLQVLVLDNNTLEDGIPTQLGQLTALQELILHTNNLDGTLPTELGQFTALSNLQLYTNNLLGALPSEFGNWTVLERFDIHDNRLTGTLPTEIGHWSLLEEFHLYRNYMGGTIPTELGLCQALTSLRAQSNVFYGTLPTELGQLTNLEQLYIYDNSLSGTVPAELANSTSGTTLQVIFEPQNLLSMGGGIGMDGTVSPTPESTSNATTTTESSAVSFRQPCGLLSVLMVMVVVSLVG